MYACRQLGGRNECAYDNENKLHLGLCNLREWLLNFKSDNLLKLSELTSSNHLIILNTSNVTSYPSSLQWCQKKLFSLSSYSLSPLKSTISLVALLWSFYNKSTSAVPAAGRPPPRRLNVRRPGGWTSVAPAAGRPPPRRLNVRRPGGWTFAASATGRTPPRRLHDSPSLLSLASRWD